MSHLLLRTVASSRNVPTHRFLSIDKTLEISIQVLTTTLRLGLAVGVLVRVGERLVAAAEDFRGGRRVREDELGLEHLGDAEDLGPVRLALDEELADDVLAELAERSVLLVEAVRTDQRPL